MASAWHSDPLLMGRFHANYPDDLQIIIHDGGPRLSTTPPELLWVRLHEVVPQPRTALHVYRGTLLNSPERLSSFKSGDPVLVLAAKGSPRPIRTTERYLEDREHYDVLACTGCGLAEMFDPPSALMAKLYPHLAQGAVMERFISRCPLCGGMQEAVAHGGGERVVHDLETTEPPQRWWKDWKPFPS